MKTKRILSLVLAFAMLAAVTASAADFTKLYHMERFDYESAAAFISSCTFGSSSTDEATGTKYTLNDGNNRTGVNLLNVLKYTTSPNPVWTYHTTNGGGWKTTESAGTYGSLLKFVPATLGKGNIMNPYADALGQYNAETNPKGSRAGMTEYVMAFAEPYTVNDASETLVLSFVAQTNHNTDSTLAYTYHNPVFLLATNEDGTKASSAAILNIAKVAGTEEINLNRTNAFTATTGVGPGMKVPALTPVKFTYGLTHDANDPADGPDVTSVLTIADGTSVKASRNNDVKAMTGANRTVRGFLFASEWKLGLQIGDIRMYSIKNAEGAFNADFMVKEDVLTNTSSMKIKISQPVEPSTYTDEGIVVKAGDVTLSEDDYTIGALTEVIDPVTKEYYNELTISFNDLLEASTTYTVELPGTIKNELGTALEGYNVASFTTKTPDILFNSFDIISGFASADEAAAEGFVANGSLQGAKLNLTNTTDAAKNVAVIYAVYASNGQLKDIVYVNDDIAADSSEDFQAGVKLSEAGKVKAFVWDGINSLKPQTDATVKTIAAE